MMNHRLFPIVAFGVLLTTVVVAHSQEISAPNGPITYFDNEDGIRKNANTDVDHRYPRDNSPIVRVPLSALAPIPPNVLNYGHDYALGEASIPYSFHHYHARRHSYWVADAKGRATFDRHRSSHEPRSRMHM